MPVNLQAQPRPGADDDSLKASYFVGDIIAAGVRKDGLVDDHGVISIGWAIGEAVRDRPPFRGTTASALLRAQMLERLDQSLTDFSLIEQKLSAARPVHREHLHGLLHIIIIREPVIQDRLNFMNDRN